MFLANNAVIIAKAFLLTMIQKTRAAAACVGLGGPVPQSGSPPATSEMAECRINNFPFIQ